MSKNTGSANGDSRIQLDWKARATISVVMLLMRVLKRTWTFHVIERSQCDRERTEGRAVIFCLWHGQMLPLLAEHARPTTVLISEHRDGEIIARVIERLGLFAVRGSTSRGGHRALLAMVQAVRDGRDVAVTPDGPRGPYRTFAPGALAVSQRSGAAIVPLGCHCSSAWRMKTWDQFEIPKPFARITVVYGATVHVNASSARDAASEVERFTALMQDVQSDAANAARAYAAR